MPDEIRYDVEIYINGEELTQEERDTLEEAFRMDVANVINARTAPPQVRVTSPTTPPTIPED